MILDDLPVPAHFLAAGALLTVGVALVAGYVVRLAVRR